MDSLQSRELSDLRTELALMKHRFHQESARSAELKQEGTSQQHEKELKETTMKIDHALSFAMAKVERTLQETSEERVPALMEKVRANLTQVVYAKVEEQIEDLGAILANSSRVVTKDMFEAKAGELEGFVQRKLEEKFGGLNATQARLRKRQDSVKKIVDLLSLKEPREYWISPRLDYFIDR